MLKNQLELEAAKIVERFSNTNILGLDGWTGVGKTTLGRIIGTLRVPTWPLDVDAFIAPQNGNFKDALQLCSLRSAIENATVPIVASGICLLEVFQLIGLRLDSHVYIKRFNAGIWANESEALGNDLQIYEDAGRERDVLRNEIRDYHLKYRPHEVADLIVEMTH